MAMFTNEFIAAEINNLDLVADNEAVVDAIRQQAEDFLVMDDFVYKEVLEKIDQAIFNANLPEAY